ncbi:MAG: DHH family phosphoesterase [Planctomycetota bacterium]|jgi:phosphoesterase RecJ-like protein
MTDCDFQQAIELIDKSGDVLVITHSRPDGDACGCVVAMAEVLKSLGKNVKMLMLSQVPKWYEFLFDEGIAVLGNDVTLEQLKKGDFFAPELIVIVDTNSLSQLPGFDEYLKENDRPILIIDHHITNDGLGEVELIDTSAAASGVIVFDLLKYAGWKITEKIAQALFVAIVTDTGWFRFGNTDSRTLGVCAELIKDGLKPASIYKELYQKFSPQRFKLMTVMLGSLELCFDGRYAVQCLRQGDFEETGASYSDTEDLINECQRIGSVEAAALFVERADGRIKCSLRSSGEIDVSQIAQKFGGGGHKAAAGTHLDGPIEKAKEQIKNEVEKRLKN